MSQPVSIPREFPPPADGTDGGVGILFVAGEHSGDEHAARVITDLRRRRPDLHIAALGGPAMQRAGAQLLFDMTRFSAVGLVEVAANYGFYKKLFARTLAWIKQHRPRLICFVDYPGFNLRLAERLRAEGLSVHGGGTIPLCFYISPQIWAWKAGRRFEMARILDSVGVIFPFEVDCYRDTSLPVRFVGHPFVATGHPAPVRYAVDGPVLLLPGSRPKAVRKIFPVLLRAWRRFLATHAPRQAVVLHPGAPVLDVLYEQLADNPDLVASVRLVERGGAVQPASATLTSSGTMSLSLALAGIPGAVVYRANPLTWAIGRRLVKGVEYLGIANILLKRPAWPEYLQGAATPTALAERLKVCLDDPAVAYAAQEDAATLHTMLGGGVEGNGTPADWLLEHLGSKS
ncbi:MAG: lipid-A-disaccharide synthase [Puniceicoccales bacterium]|jgi:lipid-A-disaccharide synthase|nr:lipid-A-disaccharide synthase [Puniceicoccales bacterium]